MMSIKNRPDIFDFWKQIKRGEHIHPADEQFFDRVSKGQHGFDLDCLPACFDGPLRSASVVLLYLSPGLDPRHDRKEARTDEGKEAYLKRWTGNAPISGRSEQSWLESRTRDFGDLERIKERMAILNIGAYHSKNVQGRARDSLLALPSSRVALGWAQEVLFPEATSGKRIVVCMRSAALWGLEIGRKYEGTLFAPKVNRAGYLLKDKSNEELKEAIREAIAA